MKAIQADIKSDEQTCIVQIEYKQGNIQSDIHLQSDIQSDRHKQTDGQTYTNRLRGEVGLLSSCPTG